MPRQPLLSSRLPGKGWNRIIGLNGGRCLGLKCRGRLEKGLNIDLLTIDVGLSAVMRMGMGTGWHLIRRLSLKRQGVLLLCAFPMFALALPGASAADSTNSPLPSDEWVVRSWQTKDGLPENTVYALLQTRRGYLWVGTGGGLARFDGVRFRAFGLQDGLGSVSISSLAEDSEGSLWVGTRGGGLSRGTNRRFKTFSQADGFGPVSVEALAAAKDGTVWIGTVQGLFRWRKGTFTAVTETAGLPQKHISAVLEDSRRALWVSTLDALYKGTNDYFVRVEEVMAKSTALYSLGEDREGNIWAGGGNGSLWQISQNRVQRFGTSNGVPFQMIQRLVQGKQGPLWIGTRGGGLHYWKDGTFQKVSVAGWELNSVLAAFVDRDNNVWIGGGGLNRLSHKQIRILGVPEGLAQPTTTSVAEDSSGNLWASTQNGGVYNSREGHFSKVDEPVFSGHPQAYTMLAASDGSIWSAGEEFLYRFRPGQAATVYTERPVGGEAIRALCEDEQGAIWAGTYYSTLLRADDQGVRVVMTNGSFGGDIRSLVRAGHNSLWIGTGSGLYHWEPGKVKLWTTREGLLSAAIQALHLDPDGTLWIGTLGGGLSRLKDGKICNVTTREGLADDVVSQIVADDSGCLWLGCNHGIMRVAKKAIDDLACGNASFIHVLVIGQSEGMLQEQCSGGHSPTALKMKNGRLLFPTVEGIAEIDPRAWVQSPAEIPQAGIEDIKVDGQVQLSGTDVVLPPGSRHLELNYAAPSLSGTHSLQFRFRMEPLEKAWVNAGLRRTAYYPNLRPGHYVFRVSAGGMQGDWNEKSATVAVVVQPYFWQSAWFQFLLAAALCGAAVGWYWRHIEKLEQRRITQQNFTHQLLHSQENERKRIAAELHDGLGQDLLLIKNRVELLVADKERAADSGPQLLQIAKDASRAITDVRSISQALRPIALEQVGLTKAIEWMGEQLSETSTVKISMDLDNIDDLFGLDEQINAYRIVQEALNNAMKHAKATEVIVEVKRNPTEVSVSIFDNGCGFEPRWLGGNGEKRAGLGLAGMKERAAVLHGSLLLQSAPGKGTRLTVTLPVAAGRREGL